MEFFIEAISVPAEDSIRFPALILEPSKVFVPSHVTFNLGADQKTVQVRIYFCNFKSNKLSKVNYLKYCLRYYFLF